MATTDDAKGEQDAKAREEAEVAARRSFLKAGTTAGVTGASVLTLGRKAWATTSGGASGAPSGRSS